MRERWVVLSSPALDSVAVAIRDMEGEEELNRLFVYRVHATIKDAHAASERAPRILEGPMTIRFEERDAEVRSVHGIVRDIDVQHDVSQDVTHLFITVVPRAWLMTQRYGAEIFLDTSVPEILTKKLRSVGLEPNTDYVVALRESYPVREIVAQYEESDHAFFSRLCEHEGIVTFYEHRDGRDVIVLADTTPPYPTLAEPVLLHRSRRDHPAAYDVHTRLSRLPAQARVHDYNYRAPRLGLDRVERAGRHVTDGDWVEFGAHTKKPAETERIARIRAQERAADYEVVQGGSTALSMRAGGTFTLHDDAYGDRELLVTNVRCRARLSDDSDPSWDNTFTAIPRGTPFRPPRITPRPRVSGLLNARVDGEIKGHYAELDEAGRYHVQLALDRSGRTNLTASHPVRMMQPHAGSFYGMHFPLRPGAEVLVGFVDGNPDRPIIIGSAPNPETTSPVVRANQTQNVLRTGSNNEMVIEDEHGTERIRVHTPKHDTTLQLGAVEEPEEGALLRTESSISQAARTSHNVATRRTTMLSSAASQVVGDSAYVLTGLTDVVRAAERGLETPGSLDVTAIGRGLSQLSLPPDEYGYGGEGVDDDGDQSGEEGGEHVPPFVGAGGLWSEVGESLHAMTENAAFDAVRGMAEATDEVVAHSQGRAQGEPVGSLLKPAFIAGSPRTSAMFSRDRTLVYADRLAAVSSHHTVSLAGKEHAELKSPACVEVAGGERVYVTSAGELDMDAHAIRMVAGYYPVEAPLLDEGTSIGVMSRCDLRLVSVEDCILLCAQKDLIGSAHTGDIRLQAEQTLSMKASSIVGSAGTITLDAAGDILIQAGGKVTIKADAIHLTSEGPVYIDAPGQLHVRGSTTIAGDLSVSGTITCDKLKAEGQD